MSLTVAGLLAPVLTDANVDRLVSDCAGMTKREAEEHLVALRPKPVFVPSIRKAPSRPAAAVGAALRKASSEGSRCETTIPRPALRVSPTILEPARPQTFNFRFAADQKFKEKFERLAEVLGVENPLLHMAEILEQAMDIALDKKDVKRKYTRRLARKSAKRPRPDEVRAKSRYLSSQVRERVHERAGYQCEYRSPDGTRCRSRTGLEIEHERPFAIYRSHDEKHLRLFCRPHNRLAAEKFYGAEFMEEKIAASSVSKRHRVERLE